MINMDVCVWNWNDSTWMPDFILKYLIACSFCASLDLSAGFISLVPVHVLLGPGVVVSIAGWSVELDINFLFLGGTGSDCFFRLKSTSSSRYEINFSDFFPFLLFGFLQFWYVFINSVIFPSLMATKMSFFFSSSVVICAFSVPI